MTRDDRRSSGLPAGRMGEGLRRAFRLLAGGQDLHASGMAVLARACHALDAAEAAMVFTVPDAAGGAWRDLPELLAGPRHGRAAGGGPLGARPLDSRLIARAVVDGQPLPAGEAGPELWCPMTVERRAIGVLALRREHGAPHFSAEERAFADLLATGAAVAVDRLRLHGLWWRKLAQVDATYSQLLRYAGDLRATFVAERRHAERARAAYEATVQALAAAVEAKDTYTGGHLNRVKAYGVVVCEVLGGSLAGNPELEYAFLLHDLGKIGVPDAVLNKAGPLDDEEWALMREHPAIGLRILDGLPHMEVVREVVGSHHERWDGRGYPQGLAGEAIPLAARVFAAVDALDAMTTDRPYRTAMSMDEALRRLREGTGSQFAPDAVEATWLVDRERLEAIRVTAGGDG